MSINAPHFPDAIWDGTTPTRVGRLADRSPSSEDWDQAVAELIAVQQQLFGAVLIFDAPLAEPIAAGVLVRITLDGLVPASPDNMSVAGMTITADGVYRRAGRITLSNLVPGANYFLGEAGSISLTAPTSGFLIPVGQAQSETVFDLNLGQPIKL